MTQPPKCGVDLGVAITWPPRYDSSATGFVAGFTHRETHLARKTHACHKLSKEDKGSLVGKLPKKTNVSVS